MREYINAPPQEADARDQIVLVCTSLDAPDALLAMNMESDEQGKPVLESNPYPLTIGGAIGWLVRELKAYERSIDKPELKKAYNRAYHLNEQWDASETADARQWFSQNPDQAGELEELYTLARRELAHAHHGDASFPVIDELVEIKLLPVSDKLPRKAVLQRKKFADAREARTGSRAA